MKKGKFYISLWLPILLIVFLLVFPVGCQQGKTTPVEKPETQETKAEITDEAEPEVEETETPVSRPITGEFKRKSNRDPFIPVVGKPQEKVAERRPQPKPEPQPKEPDEMTQPQPKPQKPEKPQEPQIMEISEEEAGVRISGIMRVNGGYRAILTSKGGRSYTVSPGQKVGDWTVAQINNKSVVLKAEGYVAKLKLPEDVGAPGKKAGGKEPEKGPQAPEPPRPPK